MSESQNQESDAALHSAVNGAHELGRDTARLYSRTGTDPHMAAIAGSAIIAIALGAVAHHDKAAAAVLANYLAQSFMTLCAELGLRDKPDEVANGAATH